MQRAVGLLHRGRLYMFLPARNCLHSLNYFDERIAFAFFFNNSRQLIDLVADDVFMTKICFALYIMTIELPRHSCYASMHKFKQGNDTKSSTLMLSLKDFDLKEKKPIQNVLHIGLISAIHK